MVKGQDWLPIQFVKHRHYLKRAQEESFLSRRKKRLFKEVAVVALALVKTKPLCFSLPTSQRPNIVLSGSSTHLLLKVVSWGPLLIIAYISHPSYVAASSNQNWSNFWGSQTRETNCLHTFRYSNSFSVSLSLRPGAFPVRPPPSPNYPWSFSAASINWTIYDQALFVPQLLINFFVRTFPRSVPR